MLHALRVQLHTRTVAYSLFGAIAVLGLAACEGAIVVTATPTQNTGDTETPVPSTSPSPTVVRVPSPTVADPGRPTTMPSATAAVDRENAAATAQIATLIAERAATGTAFAIEREPEGQIGIEARIRPTVKPVRIAPTAGKPKDRVRPTATSPVGKPTSIRQTLLLPTVASRPTISVPVVRFTPTPPLFRPVVTPILTRRTPTPTPRGGIIIRGTATPTPKGGIVLRPTPTPNRRATPTPDKRATATAIIVRRPTATPIVRVTATARVTATPTALVSPTATTVTATPTATAIATPTPGITPTATVPSGGGNSGGGNGRFGAGGPAGPPMSLVIGAKIYAENGTFLGDLVPDSYSFNSVCDDGGAYGSPQSVLSIKNSAGDYGNSTSHSSAFNPYALTPPEVRFGNEMLGKLTVSPYFIDAIDPHEVLRRLNCPK